MSNLDNRFATTERLLDRYVAGAKPGDFTQAEREELRMELMKSPHYRNPNSWQHEKLSKDVQDLFRLDSGADLMYGGGVPHIPEVDGAVDPADGKSESLFRS